LYSEPLMFINLLNEWRQLKTDREKERWTYYNGIVFARMRYFDSASSHLCSKLQQIIGSTHSSSHSYPLSDESLTEKQRINFLRLILAWTSEENILRLKPQKVNSAELKTLTITNELLTVEQIESLFPSDDCLWQCNLLNEVSYTVPLKSDHLLRMGIDHCISRLIPLLSNHSNSLISWLRESIDAKRKVDHITIYEQDSDSISFLTENLTMVPSSEVNISVIENYITFSVEIGGNKKRLKQMNVIRESFSSHVYVVLQPKHFLQIEAVNCVVSQYELRQLFLTGTGIEDPIQQKQKELPKQLIVFNYPDTAPANPLFPITEDIPLGLKLHLAYLSGYNKSKYRTSSIHLFSVSITLSGHFESNVSEKLLRMRQSSAQRSGLPLGSKSKTASANPRTMRCWTSLPPGQVLPLGRFIPMDLLFQQSCHGSQ
jgi:hypothetical protein